MADNQDAGQRTEDPTPKRLEDARRKGDAPKSQELISTAMLAAGAVCLWFFSAGTAGELSRIGAAFLDHPHAFAVDGRALTVLFGRISMATGLALASLAAAAMVAAIVANAAQARPVFSTERLKPSLSRLSPLEGAKRQFGPQGLFNFAKGLVKLVLVGSILVSALWPDRRLLEGLPHADEMTLLLIARDMLLKLTAFTLAAMLVLSALDFAWQHHTWRQRLRMTREEVRREQREQDGDPQIKARQRQLRETRARRRMLAAVKDATVLIMNPTHFAVALHYAPASTTAPVCTAKGVDDLALRLRAEAEKHRVPIVENPPLARALHASTEIDAEIPLEHYEAVAKVIGFVMAKARRRRTPQ